VCVCLCVCVCVGGGGCFGNRPVIVDKDNDYY